MNTEFQKVNQLVTDTYYSSGVMVKSIEYFFKIIKRFSASSHQVLEIGPAEGVMTNFLADHFKELEIVEPVTQFCKDLWERYPEIRVHNCLIEHFDFDKKFDLLILGHVLEHVEHPVEVLTNLKKYLKPDGKIICSVPNANSLHRQAAVKMGILKSEDSLNEQDIRHGHRRVFDPIFFRKIFNESNYTLNHFGGYWLKTLSNAQIEKYYSGAMIDSYLSMGEIYPDIAAEIYVVASLENR